ncbi:hypothetical protein F3Y22_tig00111105pilonHSYRG00533 [Hibiscus syriacus]|uniref:GS catalytic domain-containing protein n=1 Tax=Hibiscus syriacus TaxID=106335 RepID=A0A6A2Z185_HIBSY|nr:hypothetical protein F3Y22_tig00111105pilonHSYRG00533 [Hibiscus syriacus]
MVLADMHLRPGEPWEYCPREALRRVSKVLKDECNLVMNAGFESEFFLLKKLERSWKWSVELALGHSACTYAANKLIFAREAVRAVANKHGLLATFVPK